MALFLLFLISLLYTYRVNCYMLQTDLLSFNNANALCLFQYDTTLASIHNDTQNIEAKLLCNTTTIDCWIGLTDQLIPNNYYWMDATPFNYGTNISITSVRPWGNGEPSQYSDEIFVRLKQESELNWYDITAQYYYSLCNTPASIPIIYDNIGYVRIPTFNTSLGVIDILDEIYVAFDIIIHSWPVPDSWSHILRIGNSRWGRYPLISLDYNDPNKPVFHCSFSHINAYNPFQNSLNALQLNTQYHIELYATQNRFTLKQDGIIFYDNSTVSHSILFNQNIYLSQATYAGANNITNCSISNLQITTSNSHMPNGFNYLCDYNNRFTVIKGNWSIDETNCILTQHNISSRGAIVWLGDIDTSSLLWSNYKIEVIVNILNGSGGQANILFRAQTVSITNDGGQQYSVYPLIGQGVRFAVFNDSWTPLIDSNHAIEYNIDYILRVEATDDVFDVYFENEYIYTVQHNGYKTGSVGLRTFESSVQFKSLRITFPTNKHLITVNPTMNPTNIPSHSPSYFPTNGPSNNPTYPTNIPSYFPSINPTYIPTDSPSNIPTMSPSNNPTNIPSPSPTYNEGVQ
eukprot:172601_1